MLERNTVLRFVDVLAGAEFCETSRFVFMLMSLRGNLCEKEHCLTVCLIVDILAGMFL